MEMVNEKYHKLIKLKLLIHINDSYKQVLI